MSANRPPHHFDTSSAPVQKRLTNNEKKQLENLLSLNFNNNKLKHGMIKKLAADFSISRITVYKIWKVVLKAIKEGILSDVERRYKGKINKFTIDLEKVTLIPLHLRINIRTLSCQLGASKSVVHRLVQRGKIRSHSNALKPFLTSINMEARVNYVLKSLASSTLCTNPTYDGMYRSVPIDEKWFYMTRATQKYYLLPSEPLPHRTCKSKKFITKIMFMSAIARPRYDENGVCIFDGKIGIFSFTVTEPTKRASKNRARGVLEIKLIESITKFVIKQCLIQNIIPAIKAKWPSNSDLNIVIQQDNAKPHIQGNDQDFINAAQSDGFNLSLVNQLANNPDLNINDLGFFRTIQGLQHEKAPKTVCQLVDAVTKAYAEVSDKTINFVWLSLMSCMNGILKHKGNNKYPLPHIGKKRLERSGILPTTITAPLDLV